MTDGTQACFEAEVEDVLLDFAKAEVEGDVDLLSGITFRRPRPDPPLRESLRRA